MPKVFIIILNYNGKDFIQKTLTSVLRINYPDFETVLVDNNSTDGSMEMAKGSFPRITLIKNNENLGFSAGNNAGIKYALERGADYILLLNYDTEVRPDFLSVLIDEMERDESIGIGSPVILEKDGSRVWFSGGKIDWMRMKTKHKTDSIEKNHFGSDYITGCAMAIKKDVFKKIGLFDEDYFLYLEDADFSQRAKEAGFKLMVSAQSRIIHHEKSEENKERKVYWLVLSGLIFFKKNSPLWLRPWIFAYTLARKIKNRIDTKFGNDSLAFSVQKAYQDFNGR